MATRRIRYPANQKLQRLFAFRLFYHVLQNNVFVLSVCIIIYMIICKFEACCCKDTLIFIFNFIYTVCQRQGNND
jgi:hypothetical protein